MIKLVAAKPKSGTELLLRFSDGAWGIYDFGPYVQAATELTAPLVDPAFFTRYSVEAEALVWPNGFDLSAQSLYERLQERGQLHRDAEAA